MKRLVMITLLVLVWVSLEPAGLLAAGVSTQARYWPSSGGYLVDFTYINSTSDQTLWNVSVGKAGSTEAWGPTGWHIVTGGRSVDWNTQEWDYAIAPRSSKGGFLIAETALPSQYYWWANGTATYSGYVTPLPIPEPSCLLALACGLAGLGGFVVRRRRT